MVPNLLASASRRTAKAPPPHTHSPLLLHSAESTGLKAMGCRASFTSLLALLPRGCTVRVTWLPSGPCSMLPAAQSGAAGQRSDAMGSGTMKCCWAKALQGQTAACGGLGGRRGSMGRGQQVLAAHHVQATAAKLTAQHSAPRPNSACIAADHNKPGTMPAPPPAPRTCCVQ